MVNAFDPHICKYVTTWLGSYLIPTKLKLNLISLYRSHRISMILSWPAIRGSWVCYRSKLDLGQKFLTYFDTTILLSSPNNIIHVCIRANWN